MDANDIRDYVINLPFRVDPKNSIERLQSELNRALEALPPEHRCDSLPEAIKAALAAAKTEAFEEAAQIAYTAPEFAANLMFPEAKNPDSPYDRGRADAAAAIRARCA